MPPRHLPTRCTAALALAALLLLPLGGSAAAAGGGPATGTSGGPPGDARDVMYVGNNWAGTADVVDARTFEPLLRVDVVPDRRQRLAEIAASPDRLAFFLLIRQLIGEGNDQLVDDVFSSPDGTEIYVSRPSLADVVAIDLASGEIRWRFEMDGYRADHMGLSPDGQRLLVSDSTANVVHQLDPATGERTGGFASGDSPHENLWSPGGDTVLHASIGRVYTPTDRPLLGPIREVSKGERVLQVVDGDTLEVEQQWDVGERLAAAGHDGMDAAVRPMTLAPDGRHLYFQVSFHHGLVEFDLDTGRVLRVADLPVSAAARRTPPEAYLLDSAHHGLAMNPSGTQLCAAGTMDDYAALVDRDALDAELVSSGSKPYWATNGPDGERCWVSYSGDDEVAVIDYASRREIARVPVGEHPQRVRAGTLATSLLDEDPPRGSSRVSGR